MLWKLNGLSQMEGKNINQAMSQEETIYFLCL